MARTYSDVAEPRYVERAKTADEGGTEVIANPTLVGTEDALESIQIDNTKYKVGGGAEWGGISGTLADQTDLKEALDGKLSLSGGTMTGILTMTTDMIMGSGGANNHDIRNVRGITGAGGNLIRDVGSPNYDIIISSGKRVTIHSGSYPIERKIDNFSTVNVLDADNTKANTTLAGTESNLTSLKINGTKYKVLPAVTGSDVGKFLRVDANGNIVAEAVPNANTASF